MPILLVLGTWRWRFPGLCWPANLFKTFSSRFSEKHCLNNNENINCSIIDEDTQHWALASAHVWAHTHMHMYKHTKAHAYTKEEKKTQGSKLLWSSAWEGNGTHLTDHILFFCIHNYLCRFCYRFRHRCSYAQRSPVYYVTEAQPMCFINSNILTAAGWLATTVEFTVKEN